MPDADKEFRVKVATDAETSGAQQVKKSLDDVAGSAKQGGKGVEDLGNKEKKAAEAAELLHHHHHELSIIARQIGEETAPLMGEALHAAFLGPLGAGIGVSLVVKQIAENLQKVHEEAVKLANLRWDSSIASANEFVSKINDLNDALVKAATSQDPIKDKFSEQLAVLNAELAAIQKIMDAMEQQAIAAAGGDEEKIKAIKERYDAARESHDEESEVRRMALKKKELEERQRQQPGLEAYATALDQTVRLNENDPDYIKAKAAIDLSDEEKNKLREARRLIELEGGKDAISKMPVPAADTGELGSNAETDRYVKAQQALKRANEYDENARRVAEQEETIRQLKKRADDATAKAVKNQQDITEGQKGLKTDRATFMTERAGGEIAEAIRLALAAAGGAHLTQGQQQFERTIGTMIAGHDVSTQQAEIMFRLASQKKQILESFLDRLMNAVSAIPDFGKFEERLRRLEKNVSSTNGRVDNTTQGFGTY